MSNDKRLVVRIMTYQCEQCEKTRWMYLEDGLEQPAQEHKPHKPVPFVVACPDCGGHMRHINFQEDFFFVGEQELLPWMDRFENRADHDCGVPVFGSIDFDDWKLPFEVKEGLEERYLSYELVNSNDFYSRGVVDFSIRWANLMEEKMKSGMTPEEVIEQYADELGVAADTDGITGFMYGCAVSALARFWKHGEALRTWHNAKYDVKSESGTVNPAILTVAVSHE